MMNSKETAHMEQMVIYIHMLQDTRKDLLEALIECRFRLAANQPVGGCHPNDVKAFDLADTAIAKARGEEGK